MKQQEIKFFWPLTEQVSLDLDFTPCEKYEEDKRKNTTYIGNRFDQWSIVPTGSVALATITNSKLIIYPEATPITIITKQKPSILARWVYKIIGAKWERQC